MSSARYVRGFLMSVCPITGDVDLDHLVVVLSAALLHYKGTVFPFVINNYIQGDTLRLYTSGSLKLLPTNFSLHRCILSATVITGLCA